MGVAATREERPAETWVVVAAGVSAAGDLGYTVGTGRVPGGSGRSFLRVWRVESGTWKVIADLRLPLP